jgi:hypothetical protein
MICHKVYELLMSILTILNIVYHVGDVAYIYMISVYTILAVVLKQGNFGFYFYLRFSEIFRLFVIYKTNYLPDRPILFNSSDFLLSPVHNLTLFTH